MIYQDVFHYGTSICGLNLICRIGLACPPDEAATKGRHTAQLNVMSAEVSESISISLEERVDSYPEERVAANVVGSHGSGKRDDSVRVYVTWNEGEQEDVMWINQTRW